MNGRGGEPCRRRLHHPRQAVKARPKRSLLRYPPEVRERVNELMHAGESDEAVVAALRETAPDLELAAVQSWRRRGYLAWFREHARVELVVETDGQASKVLEAKSESVDVNRANAVLGAALVFTGLWALADPEARRLARTRLPAFARTLETLLRRNEAALKRQNDSEAGQQGNGLSREGMAKGEGDMNLFTGLELL